MNNERLGINNGGYLMKFLPAPMRAFALLLAMLIGLPDGGIAAASTPYGRIYANLEGEVLLDNSRVFVQKFIVQPGQFTGHRTHPGDQLLVFVKGDEGSTNTGTTSIEMIWVTLKK